MQPNYGKYTVDILWLRLLLRFPRMLEYTYFISISQHESGHAKGLKFVYACKIFAAWPSNLAIYHLQDSSL